MTTELTYYEKQRQKFEEMQIVYAMKDTGLNVSKAAKLLGWSRGKLNVRLREIFGRGYRNKILMKISNLKQK